MKDSHISWTDHTFNPWWGCTEVSPGCDNCYARRDSTRYGFSVWGKDAQRRVFGDKHWQEPRKWNAAASAEQRALVFCASMADILDVNAPDGQLDRLWETIRFTPALLWLLLTKRPGRAFIVPGDIRSARNILPGVSVESDEYRWRIDEAAQRFGRRVFVSAEPLVGPVHLDGYEQVIAWTITGGESGPKARAADPHWFRALRDWSVFEAGVPFHFKQWGEYDEQQHRVGRVKAGRLLDGREWNERP
jgi:protein gp37